jgi:hypothetical protein
MPALVYLAATWSRQTILFFFVVVPVPFVLLELPERSRYSSHSLSFSQPV